MDIIYEPWPKSFAEKVYAALVEHAGANDDNRENFVICQTLKPVPKEWRFIGSLGFGGKIYRGTRERRVYVSYYPDDQTPARDLVVERCNIALQTLVDEELHRRAQESKK